MNISLQHTKWLPVFSLLMAINAGKVLISVGGSQPDVQTNAAKKTIEKNIVIARL